MDGILFFANVEYRVGVSKKTRPVYNIASNSSEHFILIADAMTFRGAEVDGTEASRGHLWDEDDKFLLMPSVIVLILWLHR